ncbi:MAG: recombination protein RecR [Erysipelothrix sp.]|nr:recombination protein RecR [Erysipelothrix sp.]
MYPDSIEKLIESFMVLPGVGRKTAERYVLHLLELDEVNLINLAKSAIDVHEKIERCILCHNYAESDKCQICMDSTRDKNQICVVSSPKEIISIEKTGEYHGLYHVLEGLISTRKGIMPDDLNINDLSGRIISQDTEIILALNATVEGETTALYIAKKYDDKATITRLAFGLPIGGHLDYADDLTLLKAFEGRKKM